MTAPRYSPDKAFPTHAMRLFLAAYGMAWRLLVLLVVFYLKRRGTRDPLYGLMIDERFGHHRRRDDPHVWVHAVSLGELRSAVPLIRALLARGRKVVTTHFTPAGRREAERVFAAEIAEGRVSVVWVPFDYGPPLRRFLAAFRPVYGLVMEIEFWPGMIVEARKAGIPLMLCNGQYPTKAYERDRGINRWRGELIRGFAGVMVKSDLQKARFEALGQTRAIATGELRFEQPVPAAQHAAGTMARSRLCGPRPVVTFASVVIGEDEVCLAAIRQLLDGHPANDPARPFIVYVPRAPERFDETAQRLTRDGFRFARRSRVLNEDLALRSDAADGFDILLGDSMGEMYFYLAMGDLAVVGGGFVEKGAHNIIEPLALKKPVLVGPQIWTIEYPAREAIAAGVLTVVAEPSALGTIIATTLAAPPAAGDLEAFFEAQSGALERTLAAIATLTGQAA